MSRPVKLTLLAVGTLVFLGALLLWSAVRRGFSTHDEPSWMVAELHPSAGWVRQPPRYV
jgi:hypothetical protein